MIRLFLLILMILPLSVFGQEKNRILKNDSIQTMESENDSLNISIFLPTPQMPFSMYGITPFPHSYIGWELHKGFNASLGMSVTFSPDKYAPSGVGFGQDAAFLYAIPINSRLSIAGGIYANNMNWGYINQKNLGIMGIAAYKLNEKITLYGYGNKSIMPSRYQLYYPYTNFSADRLGGMINFKLGESSSISFGVEGIRNSY